MMGTVSWPVVALEMYVVVAFSAAVTDASFSDMPSTPLNTVTAVAVNEEQ